MKELIAIQSELKAPKSQFNKFGGYKYRKAEDILEAVKPLLNKQKCTLTITDDIVMVGNRIYVKATATIKNEKGECETTTGWAREEETKKGMDGSQITGASSSYARKYALNGLFAIDDNADSDTTNDGQQQTQTQQPAAQQTASPQYHPSDLNEGLAYLSRCVSKDNLLWVIQHYQPLCSNTQFMQAVSAKKKQLGIQ
uniref:ERF superfamily protein n=1 Tax=Podoviridae sp. ct5cR14 TaxID=2825220 RepID=A0A8S5PQ57_9CAUD|nr:MAG TPA: ERF superfamily protein [Podoviridae sp. ct5cR14]